MWAYQSHDFKNHLFTNDFQFEIFPKLKTHISKYLTYFLGHISMGISISISPKLNSYFPCALPLPKLCSNCNLPHFSWWKLSSSSVSVPKSWNFPWLLSFSHILLSICQEILLVLPKTIFQKPMTSPFLYHHLVLNHDHFFARIATTFPWLVP